MVRQCMLVHCLRIYTYIGYSMDKRKIKRLLRRRYRAEIRHLRFVVTNNPDYSYWEYYIRQGIGYDRYRCYVCNSRLSGIYISSVWGTSGRLST